MPTYCFICPECGQTTELIRPISQCSDPVTCECGGTMNRDFYTERPNIGDREYARAIHSDALAVNPSQRAEHKEKFPDVPLDNECRPVFTSYRQHETYLKKIGAVKQRQRIRRRGTRKITTAKARKA